MVLCVLAGTGEVCPPIFVERKECLNTNAYIELLDKKVLHWTIEKCRDHFFFTQDGAQSPCHRVAKT
uniref:Uncharacterized protein n=1 Tax=Lepeophtheirus salmonis TaxID=72036 RepID=A0A0K2TRP8_LEPSM